MATNHKKKFIVALGSTSIYKRDATLKTFQEVYPNYEIEIVLLKAASEINSQPIGNEETLLGAMNRLKNTKIALEGKHYDFVVAMENGIISILNGKDTLWFDVGWIILEDAEGRQSVSVSTGVNFPNRFIAEAEHRGIQGSTVGAIIAQETGADEWNPHQYLTNGQLSRTDLLGQALKTAIGQLQKQTQLNQINSKS